MQFTSLNRGQRAVLWQQLPFLEGTEGNIAMRAARAQRELQIVVIPSLCSETEHQQAAFVSLQIHKKMSSESHKWQRVD